jgi:hypothetical protein
LLSFAEIGHKTFVIDTSVEVPRASLLVRPPSHQHIFDFYPLVEDVKTAGESLNDHCFPMLPHLILLQLAQKLSIPHKFVSNSVLALFGEGQRKIIIVREEKAVFEYDVVISHSFIEFFGVWQLLNILLLFVAQKIK